jgi:predicted nucleic acid-binding protein
MTRIYMDATTLIALGTIGELALLESFDGTPVVLPSIRDEVTTEPAETNLERLCERDSIGTTVPDLELDDERAKDVLGEPDMNGDVRSIAAVLAHLEADDRVAIVSDDRRLRTVADGLGATVTGTIGVIVSAVEAGLSEDDAKTVVRRVDEHGLHRRYEADATGLDPVEEAATPFDKSRSMARPTPCLHVNFY